MPQESLTCSKPSPPIVVVSLVLIALMGVILALLGGVIGWMVALYGDNVVNAVGDRSGQARLTGQLIRTQTGLYWGITIALGVWFIMWLTAISQGESILLSSAKAHQITKADAPQLWNVVEEMTIASGLGKMPRVYIMDDASMNAFAVGLKPERAAVAVTSGLLKRLNRDELQGVIAHEIGHIKNLDSKFLTTAGVMVGAIVLISQIFLRGMFYGSMGRRRSSSRNGGGAAAILMLVIAILVAVLAPIAAQMLYYACSRRREYLADASAARYTRYPPGLASALEKISRKPAAAKDVNKVVAPMYIVNPLQAQSAISLFSTHPPTKERIRILRSMGGAGFAAYEEAFRQAHKGEQCIGSQTLKSDSAVAIRDATEEKAAKKAEAVERAQQITGLLDRIINYTIIPCACGVKLKLPPKFKHDELKCPRCGRTHPVPGAKAGAAAKERPPEKMTYHRQGAGWEVFQCGACGSNVQLSPNFAAQYTNCPKCNRRIEIT